MDIQIGLLDLSYFLDTKEYRYDYYTIGRENVADVLEADFGHPQYDWYLPEKEIVRDLMLAGF